MKCKKAQGAIMLYAEGRLRPFAAIRLHKHVSGCADCRAALMAMGAALKPMAFSEAPKGFAEAVMQKVNRLPAYRPLVPSCINWPRLACCLYALLLAVGFAVLYNPDVFNFAGLSSLTNAILMDFTAEISVMRSDFVLPLSGAAGILGAVILGIGVALALALALLVYRDRDKTHKTV